MRVLVVEPYYGGSHRAWADGYVRHSSHDVGLIHHPARFWKWRMHGAFLTLAEEVAAVVASYGPPDVILASSMMDVAAFAGAVRHTAPGVPVAVFFHESQFTYPLSPADRIDFTYQMKNWASAATADLPIFNSEYHRTVFFDEARAFLKAFPEDTHVHRIEDVERSALVLPVGVDLRPFAGCTERTEPPLIVWNHRWEHDKGPGELLAIAEALDDLRVDYRVAMCGEVFVTVPPEFAAVVARFGERLVHQGWAERAAYVELLSEASVVLSTAEQEFFGIGVVEGIAAGAHPVLPERLVYPERVAAIGGNPGEILFATPDEAAHLIAAAFERQCDPGLVERSRRYDWSVVAPMYDDALESLATRNP